MHTTIAAGGLIVVAVLAGCGSTGGSAATQAGPAAVADTATQASVTVLTREQAAARYLQIVTPYNTALNAVRATERKHEDATTATAVPEVYRRQAAAVATTGRQFLAGLLSTPWPADIAPTAGQVADEFADEVSTFGRLAQARTWGDVQDVYAAAAPARNGAAQMIRVQLGLPPAT